MTNHEIVLGRGYKYAPGMSILIEYALVKGGFTWLGVIERRGVKRTRYLCQLDNDLVTISQGCLFIEGEDLIKTLEGGYVLGTIYERAQFKHLFYEQTG